MAEQPLAPRQAGPLKTAVNAVFQAITLPWAVWYWLFLAISPRRKLASFQGVSQWWSLWPGLLGQLLRRGFYRWTLDGCAVNSCIEFGTIFATPHITISDGVYIGAHCNVGDVVFGRDVLVGSNVTLLSGRRQHGIDRLDTPIRLQGGENSVIHIGEDVWIGNGAIVMADVANQAVIAAGAVVVYPVEARTIVGGNPGKAIGIRGEHAAGESPEPAGST
jgi:acetyltransferase-like isoleucine patch superfamily enzyme